MGRKSTRANKNIFQLSRESAGLTREQAGEDMVFISEDRIEKIESGKSTVRPDEVLTMAQCYRDPMLCNRFCSLECPVGQRHIKSIQEKTLPQVSMEVLHSVNALHECRDTLIDVAAASEISDEEMDKLIEISVTLDKLSRSVDSLKLWIRKRMEEG